MNNDKTDILGNTLPHLISSITILILITASYALFMFWTSINNYQSAVNITSSIENRLLNVQSGLNRQTQSWSYAEFGKSGRVKQRMTWENFLQVQADIQNTAIAAYADMHSTSAARSHLGKFLALYGDITKQYEYQKETLELGDEVGPSNRQKLNAMIHWANLYLDRSVELLHGEISMLTSDNKVFIDNGSTASVITFSLTLSMLIFLSAGLYYRQRVL